MATYFFSAPGTYTIEDDGIRGNGISVVRDQNGNATALVHPGDEMNFIAQTAGVNLIFNVLDSFGTANVNVGSLTSSAENPASIVINHLHTDAFITLVSNGSITEAGADAPADIVAAGLVTSAATGAGTAANALETQVSFIEAETNTGGINIANSGSVQIGGLTAEVGGLNVAASGDLNFSTIGFMHLADATGPQSVHGGDLSGNVTLTALGADSDLFSNIDQKMVSAAGGGITLNAGRDIFAGTSGTNFDNDILATNFVTIRAGRDFQLDGTSDVRTGAFGGVVGGPIDIQTGRNIDLSNATGGLQTIQAFAGDVILTTGPVGAFIENASFPGAVQTTDNILLNADAVAIASGGLNTTGVGSVTIRPVAPGRAIDIGGTIDRVGVLALSDAELDKMLTLNLNIGDANSGPVEFTAPVTPFIVNNMVVRSATEILVRSSIAYDGSLTLHAGNDLFFTASSGFTTSAGSFTGLVDQAQNDGGLGGIGALGGTIAVSGSISLRGGLDNDNLTGTANPDTIEGFGGNDLLNGLGGSDVLIGGAGLDTMSGGLGDDRFFVDNAGDIVTETAGEGADRVFASASWVLAAGSQVEMLTTNDHPGTSAINLTGNGFAQSIFGNAGANRLDGGGGGDVMVGLGGNDFFFVRHASDRAVEAAGGGSDRVFAAVSFTLEAGSQVEIVSTIDNLATTAINLAGNELAQSIFGNAGANALDGAGGADVLLGLGGDDRYFTHAGDRVVEAAGGGSDRIFAFASLVLEAGSAVEILSTIANLATTAINLTGNELGQFLFGNAGANRLDGKSGADVMTGFGGADNFAFTTALGAANVDRITDFSAAADTILVDNAVFAGLAPGALNPNAFVAGTAAADANDRIIYDQATGRLFFDADGTGPTAAIHFTTLDNHAAIAAGDFTVI